MVTKSSSPLRPNMPVRISVSKRQREFEAAWKARFGVETVPDRRSDGLVKTPRMRLQEKAESAQAERRVLRYKRARGQA